MYNKLFTKILDSSIWLENDSTRIIWFTLLAAMDQDGFAQFASVANLAYRARIDIEAAKVAVSILEQPDLNSSDPDHEGRRIERVPGGWMVLNSLKYQELATRAHQREQVKQRVHRHRHGKNGNAPVTPCNANSAPVTDGNDLVTPSDTDTDADVDKNPPNPPLQGGKVTRAERKRAEELRKRSFGCTHEPRCANYEACLVTIVAGLREQQEAAS